MRDPSYIVPLMKMIVEVGYKSSKVGKKKRMEFRLDEVQRLLYFLDRLENL